MKRAFRFLVPLVLFVLGVVLVRVGSPSRVTITWETASEVDAAGFRLYRSTDSAGPFTLIVPELIAAKGDPLVGAAYEYQDREVEWGQRYFYQLEEVNLNGVGSRYPEIVEARAGLGWPWAIGGGLILAVLGFLAGRPVRTTINAAISEAPDPDNELESTS